MRFVVWGLFAALTLPLIGCGGGNSIPVSGTITRDGQPVAHAIVTFRPSGEKTEGLGGSGETGADGKYTITEARGGKGLPPGEYVVVISLRLNKDGTPADPNVPPIESDARETLPPTISDPAASTLRATVSKDKNVHDFPLPGKKK